MQKAELILTKLNQKSKSDESFRFRRLYRNLYNVDFYLNAYGKIYKKEGNMTKEMSLLIDGHFGFIRVLVAILDLTTHNVDESLI